MRISAEVREMSQSELANMISSEELARIELRDPHPRFLGFVIAHEGTAAGHVIGTVGDTVKRWFRGAILKLHAKIQAGLKLFSGHVQETNELTGRIPIGEVVSKKVDQVQGRVSSIIAAWIYPEFKDRNYDVASIEANIQMEADKEHGLVVVDVDSVSAIALGQSSLGMKPGFAGAQLISALQMFANDHGFAEPRIIDPATDLTPIFHEDAARRLMGDRDSLSLPGGAILTKMAGGTVTVNGRTFGELGEEDGSDVRKIIDGLLHDRSETETLKYRDPATNPFIPRVS